MYFIKSAKGVNQIHFKEDRTYSQRVLLYSAFSTDRYITPKLMNILVYDPEMLHVLTYCFNDVDP